MSPATARPASTVAATAPIPHALRPAGRQPLAWATALLLFVMTVPSAFGAEMSSKVVQIGPQPVSSALKAFAARYDMQLIFTERDVGAARTAGATGRLSPREALTALLEGTGLQFEFTTNNVVVVRKQPTLSSAEAASTTGASGKAWTGKGNRRDALVPAAQMRLARMDEGTEDEKTEADRSGSKTARSDSDQSDGVVVTGSRIAGAPSQLAANVITLNAEDLRATGESTLERALRQLPQNVLGATEIGATVPNGGMTFNGAINITGGSNINLRGLGSESTLVLVDGRRIGKSGIFGGASDVSGIPLSSVERVEIMLDGASSVYGSDAVGGVVNIILRKDYEGAEATYQYGAPQDGGFDEHVVTLSGGMSWGSGRARASFEHFNGSNLDASDRPERIISDRWDMPAGIQGNAGLFYTYNGQNYLPADLAAIGLTTTSPGVERIVYTRLPDGQDGSNLSLQDFEPLDTRNLGPGYNDDIREGISLIPGIRRSSLQLGFDQDFNPVGMPLTLSGNLYYSERDTYSASGAFRVGYSLPTSDPRNPFATRAVLFWLIPSLGDTHFQTDQQIGRANLSLEGNVGKDWRWTLAAGGSRDEIDSLNINLSDSFAAFFSTANFLASDIVAANDPDVLADLVADPLGVTAVNEERIAELNARGTLFSLPGGNVHMALGAEWREESLHSMSDTTIVQGIGEFNGSLPQLPYDTEISRTQRSAFAELLLPIVGSPNARAGVEQLTLTGSGRYDSYDVYGSSSTWSTGLIWSPLQQLRFRTNYSTSFVVPTPREGLADTDHFFSEPPSFALPIRDAAGLPTGEVDYVGELIIGGNPDLKPEHASSWSAGLELRPVSIPGLALSATWHQTDYRDRITEAPNPRLIEGVDYVALYPNLSRGEDGLLIWDARAVNAASVKIAGIDYQLRYDVQAPFGQLSVSTNISYTSKFEQLPFVESEPINRVKHLNAANSYFFTMVPRYRYNAAVGWYRGGWSLNLDASTASDVSVSYRIVGQNLLTISRTPVLADVLLAYDWDEVAGGGVPGWLAGTRVSLKVLNVLNDHPSTQQVVVETGEKFQAWYNGNYADPRGRMFHVSLTRRF